MKKLITTTLILALISLTAAAQKNLDILYLKNGAKIFGTLEGISDNQYKIRVNDSTLFSYPMDEVEKYSREKNIYKGRRDNGLGFSLEGGILLGAQTVAYETAFSFNAEIHFAVNTTNVFGFGSGVEYLGKAYTPLFLEYRLILKASGPSPYFFARAGGMAYFGANDNITYTYDPKYYLRKDYTGGAMFSIGTGVSWAGNGVETNLSFAYRYARTGYVQSEYNHADVTYTTNYNRLEVKLGFRF
jgi:hypothetical protein